MKRGSITILIAGLFVFFIAIGANSCSPKNEDKGEPVIPTKDFLTDRMAKTPFEKEWIFREDCRFHMLALHKFYKLFPESELAEEIKITFKRWADYMMQYADVSNFGLIGGEAEDGSVRNYVFDYSNRKIGAVAWGLATAAILLDESKYLEAAEHQIQWLVGFNAADISMMAGVGRGPGCYHHRYAFMEGCEDGVVPGGILNGIVGGKGKALDMGDFTKNFVVAELPIDYPVIDTDVWGWIFAYLSNEYWTRNNSWFIMGALQIEKALRFFKGTDPKIGG